MMIPDTECLDASRSNGGDLSESSASHLADTCTRTNHRKEEVLNFGINQFEQHFFRLDNKHHIFTKEQATLIAQTNTLSYFILSAFCYICWLCSSTISTCTQTHKASILLLTL